MANLKETRTRKRGINRINSHSSRIKPSKKTLSLNSMLPGQICTFAYNVDDPKNYDKHPLILFLYRDKKAKLNHAINLHYLNEKGVQLLFEKISKHTSVTFGSSKNLDEHHVKVDLSNRKSSKIPSPIQLYEKAVKPLMKLPNFKNSYRTFSESKVSGNFRIVNYKLDIIEKRIRRQTGITKGESSTSELFKGIESQDIGVTTGKDTK